MTLKFPGNTLIHHQLPLRPNCSLSTGCLWHIVYIVMMSDWLKNTMPKCCPATSSLVRWVSDLSYLWTDGGCTSEDSCDVFVWQSDVSSRCLCCGQIRRRWFCPRPVQLLTKIRFICPNECSNKRWLCPPVPDLIRTQIKFFPQMSCTFHIKLFGSLVALTVNDKPLQVSTPSLMMSFDA